MQIYFDSIFTAESDRRKEKIMQYNKKVDFHSHFLTETYLKYLQEYEDPNPDGFPTPLWSVKEHIQEMDSLGIAFAFISVSSPNLSGADRETEIRMVRSINTEGAELVSAHSDRLGLFASLPLPHVEAAIEEAAYALDELQADGFGLSTHYAGVYLGSKDYDPLMEFLNNRSAVVAVHPVTPAKLPQGANDELPIPAMEFLMDTTRTFTNMVMHDIFGRFPKIKWVFPHAGSFISILSDRMSAFSIQFKGNMKQEYPLDFKGDMRHVWFDLAGFPLNKQIHDLLLDIEPENLLYGSDSPYTPKIACTAQAGGLENTELLSDEDKEKMFTLNAVGLVPRLADILQVKPDGSPVNYANRKLSLKEKWRRFVCSAISKLYGAIIH